MGCAPSSPEGSTADADASSLPRAAPTIRNDRYYTRVVFLDVDGVLHTGVNNNARHLFHEHCMANLREIVHGPLADVGIVLSPDIRILCAWDHECALAQNALRSPWRY